MQSTQHHAEHGIDAVQLGASFFNFAILVVVLIALLRKPLQIFLEQRRRSIEEALQAARHMEAAAAEKKRLFDEKLAGLERELEDMRRELMKAAEQERDRMLAEAEHKASLMRQEAKFLVEQELKQLRIDILNGHGRRAVDDAALLLAKHVDSKDHERMAHDFLENLKQLTLQKPSRKLTGGSASMPPIPGGRGGFSGAVPSLNVSVNHAAAEVRGQGRAIPSFEVEEPS